LALGLLPRQLYAKSALRAEKRVFQMARYAVAISAILVLLSGCAHSNGMLPPPSTRSTMTAVTTTTGSGTFVEYSLPAGTHPFNIGNGPYNTLWFVGDTSNVYLFEKSNGHVHTYTNSQPFFNYFAGGIVDAQGFMWFMSANPMTENDDFLGRISPAGTSTFYATGVSDTVYLSNIALGSDGRLWFAMCQEPCDLNGELIANSPANPISGNLNAMGFQQGYVSIAIAAGPGGFLYIPVIGVNVFANSQPAAVDIVSTKPQIVHIYSLPDNSYPNSITRGSDGNMWITEQGINKIVRMTPAGAFTQFSIPTANAGLNHITYGWDGALWFTEGGANKIGRITTSGAVTEYRIPTPNSGPYGILPCNSTECPPHGGVWFAQPSANKIGKFILP
jgi:streptogramin lyase